MFKFFFAKSPVTACTMPGRSGHDSVRMKSLLGALDGPRPVDIFLDKRCVGLYHRTTGFDSGIMDTGEVARKDRQKYLMGRKTEAIQEPRSNANIRIWMDVQYIPFLGELHSTIGRNRGGPVPDKHHRTVSVTIQGSPSSIFFPPSSHRSQLQYSEGKLIDCSLDNCLVGKI